MYSTAHGSWCCPYVVHVSSWSYPVPCTELCLWEAQEALSVSVCQAVMPVSSSPALLQIYHSPKFDVSQKCDESAFHAIFHVVNENIHHSIRP